MIEWWLAAIGGLSFIIVVTGMAMVMLCAAHDTWITSRFVGKFFAVLFGALGVLLMAPLALSIYLIIRQCINAIIQ